MTKAKILFADNDPDFLETRAEFLKQAGYHVVAAFSPIEAYRRFEEEHPDLTIVDIRLVNDDDDKDTSGLEFAKSAGRSVPVIVLTGYPVVSYLQEALRQQPNGSHVVQELVLKEDGPVALLTAVQKTLTIAKRGGPQGRLSIATSKNLPSQTLVVIFTIIPRIIGRTTLDLFGRDKAVDSTAVVLGYVIIVAIILGVVGVVDWDKMVNWFASWWRFFFPAR